MGGLVGASQRVGKFERSALEVQLLSDVMLLAPFPSGVNLWNSLENSWVLPALRISPVLSFFIL